MVSRPLEGITEASASTPYCSWSPQIPNKFCWFVGTTAVYVRDNLRKIGNVDEGVVERSEDTSNSEDELAYTTSNQVSLAIFLEFIMLLRFQHPRFPSLLS